MSSNMVKTFKVLDLFAGIGGLSLGFKKFKINNREPFEVIAALEKDESAAKTLINFFNKQGMSKNEAEKRVLCGDVTNNEVKNKLYQLCDAVDIIIGGPPCQSFSMIGPRSGDKKRQEQYSQDERDNLFEHYIEIVEHYKPQMFVFENVKGILSKKNTEDIKYIDVITQRFESIGYCLDIEGQAKKYMILNAANYGVPQHRERVIVIGNRFKSKNLVPSITHCHPDKSVEANLQPFVTLEDAIGDLPNIYSRYTYTPYTKNSKVDNARKQYIDQLNSKRYHGEDIVPYHNEKFIEHYSNGNIARKNFLNFIKPTVQPAFLTGHKARSQQESDIELFTKMDEGMTAKDLIISADINHQKLASLIKYNMSSFTDKYKKLSWCQPSNTIVAHLQKDGNRYIHPDGSQGRTLTVREAARLQSFPDDYEIIAIGNSRYKYIGNAVPPILSLMIAKTIYKIIKNNETST